MAKRVIDIYFDVPTRTFMDSNGRALSDESMPEFCYMENPLVRLRLVRNQNLDEPYCELGEAAAYSASMDNDYEHGEVSGQLATALSGAVTELSITGLDVSKLPAAGMIDIMNAADEAESLSYTSFSEVSGTVTFRFDETELSCSYAEGDTAVVSLSPLMFKTENNGINVEGDWEDGGTAESWNGQFSIRVNADTIGYFAKIGSDEELPVYRPARFELQALDGEGELQARIQFKVKATNLIDTGSKQSPPLPKLFYTKTEADAKFMNKVPGAPVNNIAIFNDQGQVQNSAVAISDNPEIGDDNTLVPTQGAVKGYAEANYIHKLGPDAVGKIPIVAGDPEGELADSGVEISWDSDFNPENDPTVIPTQGTIRNWVENHGFVMLPEGTQDGDLLHVGEGGELVRIPVGPQFSVLQSDGTSPQYALIPPAAQEFGNFIREMQISSFTPSFELDMSVLPSAAPNNMTWEGSGLTEAETMTVSGGILTVDTTSVSDVYSRYVDAPDIDFDAGFTYEICAKVDTSDSIGDNRCVLGFIRDGSQGECVQLTVRNTYIRITGATTADIPFTTDDDYHTYRITVKGTTWKLFIDGTFIASGQVQTYAGADHLYFGDYTASTDKNSKFYVSGMRYVLGAAEGFKVFRVAFDRMYVGFNFYGDIDESIALENNLDTGSAAEGTLYNIWACAGESGLQFLFSAALNFDDVAKPSGFDVFGRCVGAVLTDADNATEFVPATWRGRRCSFGIAPVIYSATPYADTWTCAAVLDDYISACADNVGLSGSSTHTATRETQFGPGWGKRHGSFASGEGSGTIYGNLDHALDDASEFWVKNNDSYALEVCLRSYGEVI